MGAPRSRKDVGISIFADAATFDQVADALERAGVMLDRATAPKDTARIGMFKCRYGRTLVDVFMSRHPHADDMQRRRRRVSGTAASCGSSRPRISVS